MLLDVYRWKRLRLLRHLASICCAQFSFCVFYCSVLHYSGSDPKSASLIPKASLIQKHPAPVFGERLFSLFSACGGKRAGAN